MKEYYAARLKDTELLKNSSSGGMATLLSEYFLDVGCAVSTVTYNYDSHKAEFVLLTDIGDIDKIKGSKYMQSYMGDIFVKSEQWCKNNPNKSLLFIGMGCQADAFRKYAEEKKFRKQTFIVDIVCHGSPSPLMWSDYIKRLEKKYRGKVTYVSFKDKRNGWNNPTALCKIRGIERSLSDYVQLFYNQCILRPSCHVCPYATVNRLVDMTIGDFWGIEKQLPELDVKDGISLVIVHSDEARLFFEHIKGKIEYWKSEKEVCQQPNLTAPTPMSKQREEFWRVYRDFGFAIVHRKYCEESLVMKVKKKINKIICVGGVIPPIEQVVNMNRWRIA